VLTGGLDGIAWSGIIEDYTVGWAGRTVTADPAKTSKNTPGPSPGVFTLPSGHPKKLFSLL